jgi:hypothetical protein
MGAFFSLGFGGLIGGTTTACWSYSLREKQRDMRTRLKSTREENMTIERREMVM